MASVHDVAAYILELQHPMTTMKLQKLCYYSQGWTLALEGTPLFDEEIQAWANGPVVSALFARHRGRFQVEDWADGDSSRLSERERQVVSAVVETYGQLNGQQLSEKSHAEAPWQAARGDTPPGSRSNAILDLDVMQEYFGSLASS